MQRDLSVVGSSYGWQMIMARFISCGMEHDILVSDGVRESEASVPRPDHKPKRGESPLSEQQRLDGAESRSNRGKEVEITTWATENWQLLLRPLRLELGATHEYPRVHIHNFIVS